MAVEKHLLQNWQKVVQLLPLPEVLGWLPLSLGLLGRLQQLGAPLGRVPWGSLGQLVWVCRSKGQCQHWGTVCPEETHPGSNKCAGKCPKPPLLKV